MAVKNKVFPHLMPNIEDWPIAKMYAERDQLIQQINDETLDYLIKLHGPKIDKLISRTAYLELIRLKENPWKVDPPNERQFWNRIKREVNQNAKHREDVKFSKDTELLRRVINRYSTEIAGKFVPKTFRFARKVLRGAFRRMLNTAAGRNHRRFWGSKHELYERLHVYGDIEKIRKLWNRGTIVVVPTHSSNLDSMLIGYALDTVLGLPSFSYGAGLNLYDSEIVAYFMTRLGAYRVDRRKKNDIYLETLKTMSQLSVMNGVNSIFFPGGTRSRSGAIEQELKIGLMNSLVAGQRAMFDRGQKDKKIIIVPLILSYNVVLESMYLINGHLKSTGEENYFPQKEASNNWRNILSFAWSFFSKGSEISLSFGKPMDVFGNPLNENGDSLDEYDRKIDIEQYFQGSDKLSIRNQREFVYTKILAQKIAQSYAEDNVVLTSQIVAFVGFAILEKMNEDLDVFGLMGLPTDDFIFDWPLFESVTSQIMSRLKQMEAENQILIPEPVKMLNTNEVIDEGIKKLGIYHTQQPLRINKNGNIVSDNFKFLYYYSNRLTIYELDHFLIWDRDLIMAAEEKMTSI